MLIALLTQEHAAQVPAAEHAAGPTSPFMLPDPGLIIWTWIVFLVLFLILKKFAWPGILKATEEREAKIKGQLAEADRLNTEAKAALAEGQRLHAEARSSAQAMLADSRAAVEKDRATSVDKLRAEQDALVDRARRDIAAEKDKAIADLRREAVDLALSAAAKVIGQRLDSDADRKIVIDYLAKVETH
jgi:F-type H+-transporting ATPase subunit b